MTISITIVLYILRQGAPKVILDTQSGLNFALCYCLMKCSALLLPISAQSAYLWSDGQTHARTDGQLTNMNRQQTVTWTDIYAKLSRYSGTELTNPDSDHRMWRYGVGTEKQ